LVVRGAYVVPMGSIETRIELVDVPHSLSVANLNSGGNRGLKQAMAVPLPGI